MLWNISYITTWSSQRYIYFVELGEGKTYAVFWGDRSQIAGKVHINLVPGDQLTIFPCNILKNYMGKWSFFSIMVIFNLESFDTWDIYYSLLST